MATSPVIHGLEALGVELRIAMGASAEHASRLLHQMDLELQQILLERRGGARTIPALLRASEPSRSHSLDTN
jgi:hypothetical protein